MKKMMSILLMLLLVLSIVPIALAEDDTTDQTDAETEMEEDDTTDQTDEETEMEAEAMSTIPGAEVRLLQLEKAIALNIERGKEVITEVENSTELESILSEMEALLTEVQNADPAAEDAVQTFVDLKHDARDLVKDFRENARELIKEEKAAQLRERIRSMEHKELKEKIQSKIRAFNAQRLQH